MLQEKIKKIIFNHPILLQAIKVAFANKFVANNVLHKHLVMKKAQRHAKECREYEQAIAVETTLTCNSRCVFCAHHKKIMTGTMQKNLFEKIADECRTYGIKLINFGVYGEPLADRFLFERIDYLKKCDMNFGFISNAALLTPEITDKLLTMGNLVNVSFSINGFSKEIYEKTMVGLNRDTTYGNVLYFLDQKEKLKLKNLDVHISAVRTDLNKKDFKKFFNFWKSQKGITMVWSLELVDRMGDAYDGKLGKLGSMSKKHNWLSPCKYMWGPLSVYFDGKVSPCCIDNDKRRLIVGDLSRQTLDEVLNGKALNDLRNIHLSGKRNDHPICGRCYLNSIWFG
jgi:MoaA/NifB/PqqE/SkfB family radical SAM enzyme